MIPTGVYLMVEIYEKKFAVLLCEVVRYSAWNQSSSFFGGSQ